MRFWPRAPFSARCIPAATAAWTPWNGAPGNVGRRTFASRPLRIRAGRPAVRLSGLDRQQRDAFHAELPAYAFGVVGNELVLRIAYDLDQPQPRRLDHPPVAVLLRSAADTGRPERGVADDAFRQLHLRHDVGDGKPAARFQQPRSLAKHLRFVGGQIDDAIADHGVGHAARQWSFLDVAPDVGHVRKAVAITQPLRLGSLLVGHIDAGDLSAWTHLQGSDEGVHSGAAAEVHHDLA